ncbi:MAG: ROK family protein [Candidatus Omnitrophica bacterium]|nr:ROK family protein [Candidatus Omnitrophota bacterium]
MKKFVISVDFGGTNIKLGLVNTSGKIVSRANLATKNFASNKQKLIRTIVQSIDKLIEENRLTKNNILGIGMGLPGLIDPKNGIVLFLPNVPGWRNVPLRNIMQNATKLPVFIDNDVNVMALGEWKYGAGKGYQNLICITLGTGVGGGMILDNTLYRGEGFAAGEIGHMPLNEKGPVCNCGGEGCFERYVGNQTLQEKAAKIFKNKAIALEDVFDLAKKDNSRAIQFWEEAAAHIGNALVGVVNLLNPRLIIIGGGVSNSYQFLGKTIADVIKKRSMKTQADMVKVVRAKLGNDAALIGAFVLVKEKF